MSPPPQGVRGVRRRRRPQVDRQAGRRRGGQPRAAQDRRGGVHEQPRQGQSDHLVAAGRSRTGSSRPIVLNSGGATASPARSASRRRTRPPRRPRELLGVSAGDIAGLLDGPHRHRRRGVPRQRCSPAPNRRSPSSSPRRRRGRLPGDHDDRLAAEARRSSRATAGRSAAWPKGAGMLAPGPGDDARGDHDRRGARCRAGRCRACAPPRRVTLRPPRLRRLHVDERPGRRSLVSGATRRRARPSTTSPRRSRRCATTSPTSCRATPRARATTSRSRSCNAASEDGRRRGRPLGRPQQPLQGGDLRQRPELGPRARRDRHDRRRPSTRTTSTSG